MKCQYCNKEATHGVGRDSTPVCDEHYGNTPTLTKLAEVACSQCIAVNPANSMAVAENIQKAFEVCRLAISNETQADGLRGTGMVDHVDVKALRAIAKAAKAVLSAIEREG